MTSWAVRTLPKLRRRIQLARVPYCTLPRHSFPPIRSLSGPFRTGFPRAIVFMGDRTNSSREEHLVLEFSANFLAIDDVVIESK